MRGKVILTVIIGFFSFGVTVQAVTVDGYCYLENQSNHSGSKVLFKADSPTAVTDSVYTDNTGYYQLDVAIGIYDIFYTHEGFGSETVYNQFISASTTLPNVTLSDIPLGVHISGDLSGLLEDTTYIVEGVIRVANNDTLTIEAGAIFYFLGDDSNSYSLWVYGSLIAQGNETDSIKFMHSGGVPNWSGIHFDNAEHGHLEYCLITGCKNHYALYLNTSSSNDSITVKHCEIVENFDQPGTGVYCRDGNILIEHCLIGNNNGMGIRIGTNSGPIIRFCTISGNTRYGIDCYGSDDQLMIDHCVISHNDQGIFIYDANGTLSNCTISGNNYNGIYCHNYTDVTILNNIIEGNSQAGIYFDGPLNSTVNYCDFYNNAGGNFTGNSIPQALGEVVTVNANGDPCDTYYNIFLDPMFVDPFVQDYRLQSGSPCIDAGDPASPLDPDDTIADMGAFYYDQSTWVKDPPEIAHPFEYRLLSAYPNPFNPATTILFEVPVTGQVQVNVYDVLGREVVTLINGDVGAGQHTVVWDAESMPSGIYFVQLAAGEFRQVKKVVLLK